MDSVTRDIETWMAQMPAADQPVEELRQRIGRLSLLLDRVLDQVAQAQQISRADWSALSVVVRHGGRCTPKELAEALELTSGTVSTRIKRLAEAGLVSSGGEADDARSRPVSLTREGHEIWAVATADRTRREARSVHGAYDDETLAQVNQHLATLLASFENDLDAGPRHEPRKSATPTV